MNRVVKTEIPDEEAPRVSQPPDCSSHASCHEQIRSLKEEVDRNRKEMQDIRMLIRSMAKNQEYEEANNNSRFGSLEAEFANFTRKVFNNEGFQANFNQNAASLTGVQTNNGPSSSFERLTPIEEVQNSVVPPLDTKPNCFAPPQNPIPVNSEPSSEKDCAKNQEQNGKLHCIFCELDNHNPHYCRLYKYPCEKIAAANNTRLCVKCLLPLTNINLKCHVVCPTKARTCCICMSTEHCNLLCEEKCIPQFVFKCEFCKDPRHDTKECWKFYIGKTAKQRKQRMYQDNRCVQCLNYNDDPENGVHTNCQYATHVCKLCAHENPADAHHHPLLCEYYHDNRQVEASKNSKTTRFESKTFDNYEQAPKKAKLTRFEDYEEAPKKAKLTRFAPY